MAKEKPTTRDILGAYPEKEQVDAFPERRYVRLTRFLSIFCIVNIACVMATSGLYFYMARNRDVTIEDSHGMVRLYSIDPEKKLLLPPEKLQKRVSALQLIIEKALRRYLEERYAYIWDINEMTKRWGDKGYVALISSNEVFSEFTSTDVQPNFSRMNQNRLTRDVHIYSLYYTHSDVWSAYIETFDFPLDENLNKKCDCMDNSKECLACKEKNMIPGGRQRKKILLRVNFFGPRTLENPFGIMVYAYYPAYIPIPKNKKTAEKFWDLPPALRPEI